MLTIQTRTSQAAICAILLFQISFVWAASSDSEKVIVLHGLARSSSSMEVLANFLGKHGYEVLNIDYPSTDYSINELINIVQSKIDVILQNADQKVHFVGYSMGCLIIRGILFKYRPPNLGRVVMLGPPNSGSEVADFFKHFFLYKRIYGPAGQELGTDQKKYSKLFGAVDFELGIIAGDRSIDPISSTIIPGADDGKVSVVRTRLPGMKDHVVIHTTHTFMMRNDIVLQQTVNFLQKGVFKRSN